MVLFGKKTPMNIVNAKGNWFKRPMDFREWIIDHLEPPYQKDIAFVKCLLELREILYPADDLDHAYLYGGLDKIHNKETGDAGPMKEDLFRMCMKEIDDYLDETKGCDEMPSIFQMEI
jgi:hypothetical protein